MMKIQINMLLVKVKEISLKKKFKNSLAMFIAEAECNSEKNFLVTLIRNITNHDNWKCYLI